MSADYTLLLYSMELPKGMSSLDNVIGKRISLEFQIQIVGLACAAQLQSLGIQAVQLQTFMSLLFPILPPT